MRKTIFFTALFTVLLLLTAPPPRAQTSGFLVIIHSANTTTEIEASRLSKIFLKKIKRWDDDTPANPVDQADDSEVRAAFTDAIHGKKVSAILSYWQRMIFSGRDAPPPQRGSDREVIEFVRKDPGAVGYVSPGADLGTGVKELKVID